MELLAGPDGGLVVVTQNDISTLTTITKEGNLQPYLFGGVPKYADGTSPAAPTSAHSTNDGSLLLATRTGEIVRLTKTSALRLGVLPSRTGATLFSNPKGTVFVQQKNVTYQVDLQPNKATLKPYKPKGIPKPFTLQAFSNDGTRAFLSDGTSIAATDTKDSILFSKKLETNSSISSIVSDGRDGVWVGDSNGGIIHVAADGSTNALNQSNSVADDCTPRPGRAPLGAIYSMLLHGSQLYAVDKQCSRIVTFGVGTS